MDVAADEDGVVMSDMAESCYRIGEKSVEPSRNKHRRNRKECADSPVNERNGDVSAPG
jgi:hypothetical protein